MAVEESDAYLNLILPKAIAEARLSTADSAFATELAYGTSRNQGFYDFVIGRATDRSISSIDVDVLCLLRMASHQLLILETPIHAGIFENVELAKKHLRQSSAGFVNAALRRISEKSFDSWIGILEKEDLADEEFLSIRYSHPLWVTRALRLALKADGAESELTDALIADNVNPKVNLVLLPGKTADTSLLTEGQASPIGFSMNSGDPSKFAGVATGAMRVQDQGSQLASLALVHAVPFSHDEKWLDICAGPGGKAVLLASLGAKDGVELTTNEVIPRRAKLVETALRHSGQIAIQLVSDGRALEKGTTYNRVLLDAPCTGLGALRRRPESRWRKSGDTLKELTSLQRELMSSAWGHISSGGVLAYVTCSPHPSETTAQVDWFLRGNSNARLIDATKVLAQINPRLDLNTKRKTVQLWPHRNGTDAMFIALIEKVDG